MDEFTKKVKYLKCRSFFPDYCGITYTSGIMRKLAGKNANGNHGYFSPEQKKKIIDGLVKYVAELRDLIADTKKTYNP